MNPFLATPRLVPVSNGNYINTLELGSHLTATEQSPARTVVLCHGFGTGLAHWYKQLDGACAYISAFVPCLTHCL